MLRSIFRGLVAIGVLLVLLLAVGAGWAAWRIASYHQLDDTGSLRRKDATLRAMAKGMDRTAPRPSFVVVLFDDLGYGDLGAFGSGALETPRIDALAAQGVALDTYYAAAPYCTPSRAGLLTGRWPIRTGLTQVVFPAGSPADRLQRLMGQPIRLPADEITLAEALRAGGYATAMVGKWHLGDRAGSLPNDLGFQHYLGVLHSNDMSPLPLWRDREIAVPDPVDQSTLTQRYTDEAVSFIEEQGNAPFLLYFAHTFPHIPLHASVAQAGHSEAGLYGDVVADLDRSVGAVLDALERTGAAAHTLVIVTSDNGPWYLGSAGGVRGRKNQVFEGGMRVPFLARWPERLPAGRRSDEVAAAVDLFPTLLRLAGVPLPEDRILDGGDLLPLLTGEGPAPDRPVYYYADHSLLAVREGPWKAHRRHGVGPGMPFDLPFEPLVPQGPWLFDLLADPDESYDVSARHPAELTRLEHSMDALDAEVARNPRGWR